MTTPTKKSQAQYDGNSLVVSEIEPTDRWKHEPWYKRRRRARVVQTVIGAILVLAFVLFIFSD